MSDDLDKPGPLATGDLALLKRMAWLMAPFWHLAAAALALLPLVAALGLAQPYLLKLTVDTALLTGDADRLGTLVLIYVAALTAECLVRFAQNYTTQLAGQRFMFALRQQLYQRLLSHSAAFHDRNPAGRVMTRVTSDVESISSLFTSGIAGVAADCVLLLSTGAMLLWLDWRLALLVFAFVPLLAPILQLFRRLMREVFRESKQLLARMNGYLAEVIAGIRVVQLYAREEKNRREYSELNHRFRDVYHNSNLYEATLYSIVELASRLATAALLWQGGLSILGGRLTFGTLVAAVEYTGNMFVPLRDLSSKFAILQSALASAERVFAILDAPVDIVFPDRMDRPPARGRIEFDRVRFAYGGDGAAPVLHELTLAIEPSEQVAVVGATGAGKSTFMKLLSRFYDPLEGAIRIDGIDLRDFDARTLRRAINIVPQDVFLFSGTVAANITLGDDTIPRARVEAAVHEVGGGRILSRIPGGLDGEIRERGSNLSVGERQLLSFARALVLDPRILVLDEATSSVDTETELLLQRALERVMAGRTTIVIAHRLSTIRHATRILVLHHGRLVEQGTHKQLLDRRGIYRRLYELQYRDQETPVGEACEGTADEPIPAHTEARAASGTGSATEVCRVETGAVARREAG